MPEPAPFTPSTETWVRELLDSDPREIARLPGASLVKENPVRTVWRIPREGGPAVYLKRFRVSLLPGALKYLLLPSRARAEWEASRGLRTAGIPAAEVLGFTERRVAGFLRGAACVVKEFPDALELVPWMFRRWGREGPWAAEQESARRSLLERLGRLLRQVHDAGYRHPDMHGGNLLVSKEGDPPELCLIDLHTVRPSSSPNRWMDLLTLLHSLLTATTPDERRIAVAAYDGPSPVLHPMQESDVEWVVHAMEERRVWSRTRPAKVFGPTGRFAVARRGDLRIVCLRAWGPEPFLAALEGHRRVAGPPSFRNVAESVGRPPVNPLSAVMLKRGGRSSVTRVEVPGPDGERIRLVVKETKVRGALDLLKNALRRPRAMDSWAAGNGLWHRHIDVAEPRALLVRGGWPFRRESFLVMEDASAEGERFDLRSLRLWGGGPLDAAARRKKRDEIERLGRLVGGLHARGVYHGDLKAVNVFVRPKHHRDSFCLVDYDRVEFGIAAVPFRRRVKNLAQLAASVGTYFSRADRLRFYRAYAEKVEGAWEERRRTATEAQIACAQKIVVTREPIE